MKKLLILWLLVVFSTTFGLNAQEYIVVQSGNDITVYYTTCLDEAVNDAPNGAVIYLSGGYFSFCQSNTKIEKKLQFIGAGYHPLGTLATGTTNITNTIKVESGGAGTSFTGIKFNDMLGAADEIVIWRCYFIKLETTGTCNNWIVDECIFNQIAGTSTYKFVNLNLLRSVQTSMTNGVNSYSLRHVNNSKVENCIFLGNVSNRLDMCNNNTISNSLFYTSSSYFYYTSSNNTTHRNFLAGTSYNGISSTDNFDNNSMFNQSLQSHFVKYTTGDNFKFDADYHIKSGSAAKEYGTDGTDLCIYGTSEPFKDNAVPYNPFVEFANIATKSEGGAIKVKIKVNAQER